MVFECKKERLNERESEQNAFGNIVVRAEHSKQINWFLLFYDGKS